MLAQARASSANKKHDIVISNQCAFDDAYDMTSMLFTDSEIFSPKTMVLNGIKTFSGKRMDEAIILAASAIEKRGGPLKELFTGILSENEGYLLPVDNETIYQPEKGIVCWISGKRVILGSRDFISEYDIVLPSDDFDKKFTKRNRCLIYLAFGGELMAVLLVTYKIDSDTAHALRALAKQRVRLLVDTRDPCIKASIISKQLGLPDDYVVIVDTQGKTALEKILRERPALKAGALCGGKMTDRIRTVLSCFRLRKSLSVGFAVQAGLMVLTLGALLVSVFSSTLSSMTVLLVLAAQGIILSVSALIQCLPGYRNLW
jgi:cation transport ATPase